ncbi:MAG: helix-turn-helix domain-containing protein [Dehalococcoidales bacterium]|jgi:excisionase family DNA binding protein|nr:helix-turn-helix domain-containing protein [Dehalococcoidales bacterium]
MDRPLTASEAAKRLGYHREHVYRLLKKGTLHGEKVGTQWFIDEKEVERVLRLKEEGGGRLE